MAPVRHRIRRVLVANRGEGTISIFSINGATVTPQGMLTIGNATSALAVRQDITTRVKAGESDNKILTSLESTYGTSILLSPATSGLGSLLWLVPVLVLLALVVAGVRLARRR